MNAGTPGPAHTHGTARETANQPYIHPCPKAGMYVRTHTHVTDKQLTRHTCMHARPHARMHISTHARTHIFIDTYGKTNERTKGQTDRQTDT